jgi:hypothetical protein
MKGKTVPVLVVLGIILVIWYVCTVWLITAQGMTVISITRL